MGDIPCAGMLLDVSSSDLARTAHKNVPFFSLPADAGGWRHCQPSRSTAGAMISSGWCLGLPSCCMHGRNQRKPNTMWLISMRQFWEASCSQYSGEVPVDAAFSAFFIFRLLESGNHSDRLAFWIVKQCCGFGGSGHPAASSCWTFGCRSR